MDGTGTETGPDISKNPLVCAICHDYFHEPCLLQCFHTFCGRCLRGRDQDERIACPLCGQLTLLKDGNVLPPIDNLMRQLLEISNSENPPCANCDKRDRSNMHYCNTCGQALCGHCRENTHRAKMFSTHEVMHMSKCVREPRKCPQHGEQFIMYSPAQHLMLCVNCFRDAAGEVRAQCMDMETAHAQAAKRLERAQSAILELQGSVRDGLIALKTLLDELRRNSDSEKRTVNGFCQGMQEAIAKTHAAMIMEVQRQFEVKERAFRGQLVALGTIMPVLQLHLVLCATFTATASKHQFIELCPALLDRLANVGQLSQPVRPLQSAVIRTNYKNEFAQSLEPWVGKTQPQQEPMRMYETAEQAKKHQQSTSTAARSAQRLLDSSVETPFTSHCRQFESSIRELSQQLTGLKERLGDLHRDIAALRKAAHQPSPLQVRHEIVSRDCRLLEDALDRQQQELERLAAVFGASWEEQLWRLRVEQELFGCQRADVAALRNELRHLTAVAIQLEPYVKSLSNISTSQGMQMEENEQQTQQHLQSLLEHIGLLQAGEQKLPRSRSRIFGQLIEKVRPGTETRERSKSASSQISEGSKSTKSSKKSSVTSLAQQQQQLENQLKDKIHEIVCRRQSKVEHSEGRLDERKLSKADIEQLTKLAGKSNLRHHKKIGKSCDKINTKMELKAKSSINESDYQRISEATSRPNEKSVKALVHSKSESKSSPSSPRCRDGRRRQAKVYPYSDGEEGVFYRRKHGDSADSLSTASVNTSRRSSLETCTDKTLVVVIGARKKPGALTLAQKQRSWETFPPKRRQHVCGKARTPPEVGTPLRKTDSFEGHEEAVKTLVAAVQETRRKPKSSN